MPDHPAIRPDSYLTLHYRIALASEPDAVAPADAAGDVVNTFAGKPATLQLGSGQLAPNLEARLVGLKAGDRAVFDLAPEEGFGPRNPELVRQVSRGTLAAESEAGVEYQPGDLVEFNTQDGGRFAGVLKELNEQHALFDFNHPLAGRALRFEVQIIGVL